MTRVFLRCQFLNLRVRTYRDNLVSLEPNTGTAKWLILSFSNPTLWSHSCKSELHYKETKTESKRYHSDMSEEFPFPEMSSKNEHGSVKGFPYLANGK